MNKKWKIVLVVLAVLVVCGVGSYAVWGNADMFRIGTSFRAAQADDAQAVSGAAATYGNYTVTWAMVDYQKAANATRDAQTADELSGDRALVDALLKGQLLLEDAQRRGLAATEEDVADMLAQTEQAYATQKGKAGIDEFCAGAGISYEDYLDILREQIPRMIARQKVRDAVGQDYCAEHDIEFTKVNQPQEMVDAVNAYIDGLLEAAQPEIVYYSRNGEQTQ